MKLQITKLREAFTEETIGSTAIALIFGGVIIYVGFKYLSPGAIIFSIFIGFACFCWGYLAGEKAGEEKQSEDGESDMN